MSLTADAITRRRVAVAEKLQLTTVKTTPTDSSAGRSRVIQLLVDPSLNISSLLAGGSGLQQRLSASEGYVLDVLAAQQRVVVTGPTTAAVFYALQSLVSLFDADLHTLPEVRLHHGGLCARNLSVSLQSINESMNQ